MKWASFLTGTVQHDREGYISTRSGSYLEVGQCAGRDDGVGGHEGSKVRLDANGAHAWAATAVGDAECLVQVQVAHVSTDVARGCEPNLCIATVTAQNTHPPASPVLLLYSRPATEAFVLDYFPSDLKYRRLEIFVFSSQDSGIHLTQELSLRRLYDAMGSVHTWAFMLAPSMYTCPPFSWMMAQISSTPSSYTPWVLGYVIISAASLQHSQQLVRNKIGESLRVRADSYEISEKPLIDIDLVESYLDIIKYTHAGFRWVREQQKAMRSEL